MGAIEIEGASVETASQCARAHCCMHPREENLTMYQVSKKAIHNGTCFQTEPRENLMKLMLLTNIRSLLESMKL
jgi:hypothetical protein